MRNPVIFCLLFLGLNSFGQNPKWINYLNGLIVNDIIRQDDFLWAGTRGGLARIDLNTDVITFFNKANSGLPDNYISSLAVRGDDLWIGTHTGIVKYSGNSWTAYNQSNSALPSDYINKITVKSSIIYVGTDAGLVIIHGDDWQIYDTAHSAIPGSLITDIDIDASNNIWLCIRDYWGYQGVVKFYLTGWQELLADSDPKLLIDASGNKWVGTSYQGLYKYDINGNLTIHNNAISDCIKGIGADSEGNIWVALSDDWMHQVGGLAKFDGSSWTYYTTGNSGLRFNNLNTLFVDDHDNVWFGLMRPYNGYSDGAGLALFNSPDFKYFYTSNSSAPTFTIDNIVLDREQNVWIDINYDISQQQGGGLLCYRNGTWLDYQKWNSGIPVANVTGMDFDRNNNLWCSAYHMTNSGVIDDGGVFSFDNQQWNYFTPSNSILTEKYEYCLHIDGKNNIWIGGGDGLYQIDSSANWTHYTTSNSNLPTNYINLIRSDRHGDLWIAGSSQVYHHDGANWNSINIPAQSGGIYDFHFDKSNILWIALCPGWYGGPNPFLKGGGLLKYDGTFTKYDTSNSDILTNSINCLEIDTNQSIWLGSDEGLIKLDSSGFTNFTVHNSPLSGQIVTALAIAHNQDIWIGTGWGEGITVYNEHGLKTAEDPADEQFRFYPNPFYDHMTLELPQDQNLISVQLFSVQGKSVSAQYVYAGHAVTLYRGNLSSGIYLLKMQTDKTSYVRKLVAE